MGIMSQRKKTSHLQQRINSAKRKSQNELINSIAAMKTQIQVNKTTFKQYFYCFDLNISSRTNSISCFMIQSEPCYLIKLNRLLEKCTFNQSES